jgi:hypothetical protein
MQALPTSRSATIRANDRETKWQLLADAGRDGKAGATGPRGERCERGSIGPRGEPAPTITGWRVDCAAYAAVPPPLSDGSEGAPLEMPGVQAPLNLGTEVI